MKLNEEYSGSQTYFSGPLLACFPAIPALCLGTTALIQKKKKMQCPQQPDEVDKYSLFL